MIRLQTVQISGLVVRSDITGILYYEEKNSDILFMLKNVFENPKFTITPRTYQILGERVTTRERRRNLIIILLSNVAETENVEDFCKGIVQLLEDANLRERMCQQCREIAISEYSLNL